MRKSIAIALVVGVGVVAGALVMINAGGSNGARTLGEAQVKAVLRGLPYRFVFRPVTAPGTSSGAVAGTAIGGHHAVVGFAISLGEDREPIDLPPPVANDAYGGPTFLMSNDLLIRNPKGRIVLNPQIRSQAQSVGADRMVIDMEEALCKATTGEPCGI